MPHVGHASWICCRHVDLAHRPKHEARHVRTRFDPDPMRRCLSHARGTGATLSHLCRQASLDYVHLLPTRALAVTSPSVRLSAASDPSSEHSEQRKSLRRSRRSGDSSPQTETQLIGSKRSVPSTCGPCKLSRNAKSNHRTAFQCLPATRPPLVAEPAETIRISIAIPRQPAGQTLASMAEVLLDACYRIAARCFARVTIDRYRLAVLSCALRGYA